MQQSRYYIIGAGFSGRAIARDLCKQKQAEILAFLDNDRNKIGCTIQSIPVLGPIEPALRSLDKTANIIIAIPRLDKTALRHLYSLLVQHGFTHVDLLPTTSQLLDATGSLVLTREIDPADFLGRAPLVLDMKKTLSYLHGKRVLVTGAGGSIGSELSKQLLLAECERLYILGHGENSIYNIAQDLKKLQATGIGVKTQVVPIIGELQEQHYVHFLLKRLGVDMIFHCAAYKHVPLMENNPIEVIKNNTFVVHFLLEAAIANNISHFILISTDKAVNPCNVYGVSKALCEELVLQAHKEGQTNFAFVRFGNVLGSRGSVIPLFKQQIAAGGPVTVTHKDMTRYFMTIPEAVSLVLLAGGTPNKTGRYLLDMGEPIRIVDLAQQMIDFYCPDQTKDKIRIVFSGNRPGEKLDETLYADYEKLEKTEYPRLLSITDNKAHTIDIARLIEELRPICFYDDAYASMYRNRQLLRRVLHTAYPYLEQRENEPEY